jgi:tetratricopeptide (TPR) repeat protein
MFVVLRHVARFHTLAGEHSTAVELYMLAASRFADFNAFQSAYRLLADAEEYAIEHHLALDLLHVRETGASIALFEGDLAFAEKTFSWLSQLRDELGLSQPPELLVNLGSLQMRKGEFAAAASTFKQVTDIASELEIRRVALMNRSACERELGRFNEARLCLSESRTLIDSDTEQDQLIELDLIEAKTAIAAGENERAVHCLQSAVVHIDAMLTEAGRLHYRRGVREMYRQRFIAMLCSLPLRGNSGAILPLIAFCKSNSFSDWMALLDWSAEILNDKRLAVELKTRLQSAIYALSERGAPVLFGYREKYDDPWSTEWKISEEDSRSRHDAFSIPWIDLNNVIREINAVRNDAGPWANATSGARAYELGLRLARGDCGLVVFFTTRDRFMQQLQACTESLSRLLKESFDSIASNRNIGRLLILPEPFNLPVFASVLAHQQLRQRLKSADLIVTVCPVLHPQRKTSWDTRSLAAFWFREDDLMLNEWEVDLVSRLLAPSSCEKGELPPQPDLRSVLQSNVVHFAAHGLPISNFTDAYFASVHPLARGLGVPELQTICSETPHKLVFLNSCFSADVLNWNAVASFQTNEQIGLPAIFLLNRSACVLASSWSTFDVSAYVFAYFFYSNLASDIEPPLAFSKAVAELFDATSDAVYDILETIADEGIRKSKQRPFTGPGQPFRHPYISGNYQFIALR